MTCSKKLFSTQVFILNTYWQNYMHTENTFLKADSSCLLGGGLTRVDSRRLKHKPTQRTPYVWYLPSTRSLLITQMYHNSLSRHACLWSLWFVFCVPDCRLLYGVFAAPRKRVEIKSTKYISRIKQDDCYTPPVIVYQCFKKLSILCKW